MFHRSHTTKRALRRGLGLVAVFATLWLSANGVLAARGGKPQTGTPATLTFDDLQGDAIQSDGLGAYAATIENQVLTVAIGKKRSLFLDFSTCLSGLCGSPFGTSTSGTTPNPTMTVWLQDTPDDGTSTAVIEFKAAGKYMMAMNGLISRFDDDGDGTIDHYVIEGISGALFRIISEKQEVPRGTPPRLEFVGNFSMPWGAEVLVD